MNVRKAAKQTHLCAKCGQRMALVGVRQAPGEKPVYVWRCPVCQVQEVH